jgi:hypothetical protein
VQRQPVTPEETIVERSFDAVSSSGERIDEVIVRVSRPTAMPDSDDWCCRYQVVDSTEDRISLAYGVDSMQSLLLCLETVRAELVSFERRGRYLLHWLGGRDLGMALRPVVDGVVGAVRGWVHEDNVLQLLHRISGWIGGPDEVDEAALTGALDGTHDESANGWFPYSFDGFPALTVHLARSPGSAVVSVRVEGKIGAVLAARIETLLDLLQPLDPARVRVS